MTEELIALVLLTIELCLTLIMCLVLLIKRKEDIIISDNTQLVDKIEDVISIENKYFWPHRKTLFALQQLQGGLNVNNENLRT